MATGDVVHVDRSDTPPNQPWGLKSDVSSPCVQHKNARKSADGAKNIASYMYVRILRD